MKKTALFAALALVAAMSVPALAEDVTIELEDNEFEFVNGDKNLTATEDSNNTTTVSKSKEEDSNNTTTVSKSKVEDSNNITTVTRTQDSNNTSEINLTVGNVTVMTSASELDATVSNNRIRLSDDRSQIDTGANSIRGSSFQANGITLSGQNSGVNSLIQQSVSVNAIKQ